MDARARGILCAVLAAAFYALNTPVSKLLLDSIQPTMLAALLYLGAGAGMLLATGARRLCGRPSRRPGLTRSELPWTVAMVALDVAAPVALMLGLKRTTAANAALLNNFEIVATALIALAAFGERISGRLWLGIGLVTLSSAVLSVEDWSCLSFSPGSLLVLLACTCWGLENNCTRRLADKSPTEIVTVKGIFSGAGSMAIALCIGEPLPGAAAALAAMLLGFAAYGVSIFLYICAQRELGAARTSAYYAVAPFVSAALSLAILREPLSGRFVLALGIMAVGAWLAA